MELEKFVRQRLPGYFVDRHVAAVVKEAELLRAFYPDADADVVKYSARLHDIGHTLFGDDYYDDRGVSVDTKEHHLVGVALARKYLESEKFSKEKINKILHCIESHRTTKPPKPRTIEAKIVASADNLAHFVNFDEMSSRMGVSKASMKLKRDLKFEFMLPEALARAKKLTNQIEKKTQN